MLPTLVRNLKQHLGGAVAEDVLKCGTILMKVIESLQVRLKDKSAPAPLLSSQISQLTGVLPEALASIRTLGRTSRARLDLIHCVFCIFYLMEPSHFELFLKDEKGMPRKQYLLTTFDILQNILSTGTAYPENWFTLMVFQYFVIRKVILEMTRQVLLRAKQVGKSAPLKPKYVPLPFVIPFPLPPLPRFVTNLRITGFQQILQSSMCPLWNCRHGPTPPLAKSTTFGCHISSCASSSQKPRV